MSYIEQDVFLFNTTIRANITLGMHFSEERLESAVRDSALDGDLTAMPLGLDTPVGENGKRSLQRCFIWNRLSIRVEQEEAV